VQVDLGQAWVGMSLVGIAEEAGCTAAQVSVVLWFGVAGDACLVVWCQVNALATEYAAAQRADVKKPFTVHGSLKPYAPFWCLRDEPEGSSMCVDLLCVLVLLLLIDSDMDDGVDSREVSILAAALVKAQSGGVAKKVRHLSYGQWSIAFDIFSYASAAAGQWSFAASRTHKVQHVLFVLCACCGCHVCCCVVLL